MLVSSAPGLAFLEQDNLRDLLLNGGQAYFGHKLTVYKNWGNTSASVVLEATIKSANSLSVSP
jgi:hypothetical protein